MAPRGEEVNSHPAHHSIHHLAMKGAPVIMSSQPLTLKELESKLKRGLHKSSNKNLEFLWEEMLDFVKKSFWTVPPYRVLKERFKEKLRHLQDLRLLRMGTIPQRECP